MDFERIFVTDYKCFEEIEISNIKPMNVIIGKNNIGKSSILDVIEMIYGTKTINGITKIYLTKKITDDLIKLVFRSDTYGGNIPGNHYEFGKTYIGEDITFNRKNEDKNDAPDDFTLFNKHLPIEYLSYSAFLGRVYFYFRRILIELRLPCQ